MSEECTSPPWDSITFIRCASSLRLTKTIFANGKIKDYDQAKHFDIFERGISDLDDLRRHLEWLLTRPRFAVVFGAVADYRRTEGVRRLAIPDGDDQPTLRPVKHTWIALDVDKVGRPDNVPAEDLILCGTLAIGTLPPAFYGVRCIVQATSGHGIKPGCRLRLWYWLDRLTSGDELAFWLKGYPVDPATIRTAQPIYTAAPVFVGRDDHLPYRLAEIPGACCVKVPPSESLKSAPRPIVKMTAGDIDSVPPEANEAFIDATLARVRNAPDGQKHNTLRAAAVSIGGIQDRAGFTDHEATEWLLDALKCETSEAKDRNTIAWGLANGRERPLPAPAAKQPRVPFDDPRRKETLQAVFRALKLRPTGRELIEAAYRYNAAQPAPLPIPIVDNIVLWAAQRHGERADA